jgi:hypothetical protein
MIVLRFLAQYTLVVIAAMALVLLFAATGPVSADLLQQSWLPVPAGRINHAPGIVELSPGQLLACWYSGSHEANPDVVILCASSVNAGETWSARRQVAGPGEQAIGTAAPNKSFGNICMNWYCGRVDARVSLDEGRTWSAPVRFDDQFGALPRAKPLHYPRLGDLVPLYLELPQTAYVRALDLAAVAPVKVPTSRLLPIPGHGTIQPSLVLLPGDRLIAYLRDSRRIAIRVAFFEPDTMS